MVNNQIRAQAVRLIDETGKQLGIVSLGEALRAAQGRGLDLIQVTEKVDPPVCRLGEYGKYLYELRKKERHAKKRGGELKEVRLTFGISPHDMETRVQQAEKFLSRGDTVRILMRLRGRERALLGFAKEKMGKFIELAKQRIPLKIEQPLKAELRGLTMMIAKA